MNFVLELAEMFLVNGVNRVALMEMNFFQRVIMPFAMTFVYQKKYCVTRNILGRQNVFRQCVPIARLELRFLQLFNPPAGLLLVGQF